MVIVKHDFLFIQVDFFFCRRNQSWIERNGFIASRWASFEYLFQVVKKVSLSIGVFYCDDSYPTDEKLSPNFEILLFYSLIIFKRVCVPFSFSKKKTRKEIRFRSSFNLSTSEKENRNRLFSSQDNGRLIVAVGRLLSFLQRSNN